LNIPIRDTIFKYERGFYYLVFPRQKPLRDFQNSSPVGQKLILKLTTKPVIFAVRPVACVQENPLRDDILCTTESTARQHPMHDNIHCAMTKSTARRNPLKIHCATKSTATVRQNPLRDKSTARQNPLHGEVLCATRSRFCSAQLQMEMEQINDKLSFETDPWRC
jgi:hypothetical protein